MLELAKLLCYLEIEIKGVAEKPSVLNKKINLLQFYSSLPEFLGTLARLSGKKEHRSGGDRQPEFDATMK